MWRQWLIRQRPPIAAGALRWLLRCCSLPYAAVVTLRNLAYDLGWLESHSIDVPVICVGNLSVGGTGKTPMVAWLCSWMRQQDLRVAIVSRGYGRLAGGSNDEALELELRLPDVPHLQNADRLSAARLAQEELDMEAIVLDDGFQHRRLARTLDIVLIDASEPSAADWLLPGGLMREPWRGLRRAAVVILTRAHLATPERLIRLEQRVARIAPQSLCLRCSHAMRSLTCLGSSATARSLARVEQLAGKKIIAFCGIGNPGAFFKSLQQQSIEVIDTREFPDHYAFERSDVENLVKWASQHTDCAAILCTMKDWVKLQIPHLGPLPLYAVTIEVTFAAEDRQRLESKLEEVLSLPKRALSKRES